MRMSPQMRFLALAVLLGLAAGLPAAAQEKVGINAAVNTDANGTPPGGATRRLVIGQEVVHNEHIATDARGQAQILFLDGSSVSVGPEADLLIDEFIYDPSTGTGKMTLTAVQGAMRFVGGKLSKQEDAVSVHLGTATIGVRGGVFFADTHRGGKSEVIFVYGKAVTVTGANGSTQELFRPGFAVDIDPTGIVSSPHIAPPGETVGILTQLDGRAGGTGGATKVPTNATVANSGVPNVVSNAVAASVQAAIQNSTTTSSSSAPPTPTVTPPQVPQNQIQVVSSQSQPVVANPPTPTPPTPIPPTPAPQPVVVQIAGLVKVAPTTGSNFGFTDQSADARIPYTGSITYPPGSGMQDGVATGADAAGAVFTLSPLTAGETTDVTATATGADSPATGIVTTSADGNFFYGTLTVAATDQQVFVMGGTPVAQSFYAPTATPQFYAFRIQPDATLGIGSLTQTIPFLPAVLGGISPGAVVSPLYAVNPAGATFGAYNPVSNNGVLGTPYLQATLDISGTGANQTSALIISTGGFSTSSDNGDVIVSGQVRGTVFPTATSPLERITSTVHSVPDANNNSLFGGTSIDGFVLDQNENNLTSNFVQNTATAGVYISGSGLNNVSYAFNQPATATTVPSNIGVTRTALNETGYFGGTMQCCSTNSTTNAIINYGLAGSVSLQTDPTSSRVAAVFSGGGPFSSNAPTGTNQQSFPGLNALTLQFGSLPASGPNYGRSTFIDNNDFAALESPNTSSVISRASNGSTVITTLPTVTSASNSSDAPSLALVTSGLVPDSVLLPSGVSFCQCQYSQWGYWTGRVVSPNTVGDFSGATTNDIASINTWVAGQPTVTMPTVGIGTYSGAAIGSVYNNGAQYLAAGGFASSFNFATSIGTVKFSNFDNNNFSGIVSGSGGNYSGSVSGNNLGGFVTGSFYGPNAAETGGNFGVESPGGAYIASGIFDAASTGSTTQPFVSYVSGAFQSTATGSTAGFTNQPIEGSGVIMYPAGATLANGTVAGTFNGNSLTLGPLTPGEVNGAVSTNNGLTGTATMTADGNFFYANLSGGGSTASLFGGVPVNPNFFAPPTTQQFYAFNIQPDVALANGSQAQTIPFLPANFGGTMANAVVSPLYMEVPAGAAVGTFNSTNDRAATMQASLAINGQGASQTSAFLVMTGNIIFSSANSAQEVQGVSRGTVMTNATTQNSIYTGGLSVPDANGNNLFGGNTISGFVLNQNTDSSGSGATLIQQASACTVGISACSAYSFNQPATATALPSGIGATRSALNETGYFGGITMAGGTPVALLGTTTIQTDPTSSRIAATFTGTDPFTAAQSGINSLVLQFGSLPSQGQSSRSRSTFIDNNNFAALENPYVASTLNGQALPTINSSTGSNYAPSLAMVTSTTVPNAINAILPAGVTPCSCQYLQWGYWTGTVPQTNASFTAVSRYDIGFTSTWIAGQPTVTMPTSGIGTFTGAAIGTVINNGAGYIAAGGFTNTYNFGANTGTVAISNFDGTNYTGTAAGSGNTYAATLSNGSNRTGSAVGTFYGPAAAETGGAFAIHATSGPSYIASGIFAGKLTGPIH
jgi:trimeric autotransporter adhesin